MNSRIVDQFIHRGSFWAEKTPTQRYVAFLIEEPLRPITQIFQLSEPIHDRACLDQVGMNFNEQFRAITVDCIHHSGKNVDLVAFEVHAHQVYGIGRFAGNQAVQCADGNLKIFGRPGHRTQGMAIRFFGNTQRESSIVIADGDLMKCDVAVAIQLEIVQEQASVFWFWFDRNDATC